MVTAVTMIHADMADLVTVVTLIHADMACVSPPGFRIFNTVLVATLQRGILNMVIGEKYLTMIPLRHIHLYLYRQL